MATGSAVIKNRDQEIYEGIATQLARAEHFGDFSYISTPLLLPHGGTVVVRVSRSIEGFTVSDHGIGAEEAALINGQHYYSKIAPKVAQDANIGFDQHSFFVVHASEGQLAGAVTSVANCVLAAVTSTFHRVEDYKARLASDRVYDRLLSVFDKHKISRDVSIVGASTHTWQFDTSVGLPGGKIVLFDAVGKHHNAVFSAVAKFHDVARSDDAPRRVAVIGKRSQYGDYLSLISQAASIVELAANDDTFKRLTG